MNLTQCQPNIPITPTMSTCSEEKLAQSPPAATPPAPPTVCAAATGKKSARASQGAPPPPPATAAANNVTTTAKPAPPAAPKKTCAANAHLYLPSQNPSHKQCRKHQNAPFSQHLRPFQEKPSQNVTLVILSRKITSMSCHEEKKIRQNLTPFDLFSVHPIPYRYPSCLPTAACDGRNRKPSGPSWAKPAPPSPSAAASPSVCATGTGKKSANASHGASPPPSATAAAKNATTTAKPAPPAAPKKTGAANTHLDLSSKKQSHRLCRPLYRKLCRKHQDAPFSQKLRAFFKKNRRKTSPSLSCHERSHQCPVTREKNSRQISTTFDHLCLHPIPYRYPSCLPTAACDRRNRKPSGPSWAKPAPPSPRAAAPPTRSCASSQRPYGALICSTLPLGRRSDFRRRARSTRPRLVGPVQS